MSTLITRGPNIGGLTPRLRMFAGPNGSGKSSLKTILPYPLLGVYINPDEIEAQLRAGGLSISDIRVEANQGQLQAFVAGHPLRLAANLSADSVRLADSQIHVPGELVNSYWASVLADYLREQLMKARLSFTFETVMSSPSKIATLSTAKSLGYRNYLYYVATNEPVLNIARVERRVREGGHAVPEEKIVSRYHRSVGLLLDAIRRTDRAYIFDNSADGERWVWLAEITHGSDIELKVDQVPAWFQHAVLDKL